jgi:hypothetical protein
MYIMQSIQGTWKWTEIFMYSLWTQSVFIQRNNKKMNTLQSSTQNSEGFLVHSQKISADGTVIRLSTSCYILLVQSRGQWDINIMYPAKEYSISKCAIWKVAFWKYSVMPTLDKNYHFLIACKCTWFGALHKLHYKSLLCFMWTFPTLGIWKYGWCIMYCEGNVQWVLPTAAYCMFCHQSSALHI